jgi:ketosteroid isomerase-like protein
MSQENVQIVRRSFQAWNNRDPVEIAGYYKEEMEFHSAMTDLFGETIRGHEAIKSLIDRWDNEWSATRWEIDELLDVDDARVLSLHRVIATGRESGVEVVHTLGGVYELRDGKIVKERVYLDRADALEAAVLSE